MPSSVLIVSRQGRTRFLLRKTDRKEDRQPATRVLADAHSLGKSSSSITRNPGK
jgi:hypothetical protein